mgnify:FL=1
MTSVSLFADGSLLTLGVLQNFFKNKKFLKSEKEEDEVSSSDDEEEVRDVKNPSRRISVSAESLSPEDNKNVEKVRVSLRPFRCLLAHRVALFSLAFFLFA